MRAATRLSLIAAFATAVLVGLAPVVAWAFLEFADARRDHDLSAEIMFNVFERASLRDQYFVHPEGLVVSRWDERKRAAEELLRRADGQFRREEDRHRVKQVREGIERIAVIFHRIVREAEGSKGAGGSPAVYEELGKRLRSQLLLRAAEVRDAARALEDGSAQRLEGTYGHLLVVVGSSAALLAFATVVVAIQVGGQVRKGLAPLQDGARRIADGDLEHRLRVEGSDEFADLALATNEMTAKLKESYATREVLQREVEERVRTEEALRDSEQRYEALFENMLDGFAHCRMLYEAGEPVDFVYLSVNPAFGRLTGLSGVAGRRVTEMIPGIRESNPELFEVYERVVSTGVAEGFETHLQGLGRWLRISAYRPRRGEFAAVFDDVTERRRAADALESTLADLRRSNADLEQFAYVASHDLQEPLRMVSSFTQLLAQRYRGKLDADADDFIGFAVDGAGRMQTLIGDLLAYSRVGTGGRPPTATDSRAAVGAALENLAVSIEETGALVTCEELPVVVVDETQLVMVFQNLIGNAIKFHRKGEPPRVHVSAGREGQAWAFRVRDNGIGIGPEYRTRLFTIFQRLHTRDEYPGSGIGLVSCKRVVERHGGRIGFESEPGAGSTFYFTLPETGGTSS